ncbi:MAG: ribosome maturation factor RimP [Gammaproteobacteria bacterium]|nr:ribosome maturation factor RimP [Gammaproteobacteria bacterium]MCP5409637.1 ribosome maturation factor RimP [Chromatiaceae bacterium]MCP5441483.1 ribosome maturation factor RimP [Chromatiaceae bacterium]
MADTSDNLINLFTPAIEGMGYELVGVEYLHKGGSGGGGLLRIYIDNPDGITLEDCSRVSHQVSGILDVEDPIRENYNLEVSSPGLDRPLFGRRDFQRFAGNRVTLKLRTKISGQRRFKGELQGIDDDDVLLAVDDEVFRLPLDQIDKARLVPEF